MKASVFLELLRKKQAPEQDVREWYREQARKVRSVDSEALFRKKVEFRRTVTPGELYCFHYDPKYKEILPVYDTFPIVFPFAQDRKGFWGINMHYLPPQYRAVLMDNLYDLINNKKYDQTTRLKLSYEVLNGSSRYRYFKPCVKHYLNSHVRSRLLYIPPLEWDLALFLPLAQFQKKSKNAVYQQVRNSLK